MNRLKKAVINFPYKKIYLFSRKFYNRFNDEKIMKEASNLTFVTVLGFVPFLLFIVFLLPEIPSLNIQAIIQKYIVSTFLPSSAHLIINSVNNLMNNTVQMNILNIIMLLITSYSLFSSINGSFDKILQVDQRKQKTFFTYMIKFFGTILIGFMIMLLLFSMSSLPFISLLFEHEFIRLLASKLIPFFIWFLLIFFIYFFVPSKRYKPNYIAISAISVAIVWFILKNGFDWYITNMTKMKVFYGVISSFPIFLFWIFANWIIVLCGIVLLSMFNKTESKQKIKVKTMIQISLEDEKEIFIEDEELLNPEHRQELEKWLKENLK